jgi:tetratricopeptide (TPR) repeat protein
LRLKPDLAEAHNALGNILLQQGKVSEAIGRYEQAVRLKPDYADAHYNLGSARLRRGNVPEAIAHFEQAVRLKPRDVEPRKQLAWLLATCGEASVRNGARALELAEKANQLAGGKDAGTLDILAAAYAEARRFDEAVRTAQAALELANGTGQAEAARPMQERLELYQAGRPYREGSKSSP